MSDDVFIAWMSRIQLLHIKFQSLMVQITEGYIQETCADSSYAYFSSIMIQETE